MAPRSFLGSLVLLVVVTFLSGLFIGLGNRPAAPAVVVCDSASWSALDEPGAFPADVAQVCRVGTVDGPSVRVGVLD